MALFLGSVHLSAAEVVLNRGNGAEPETLDVHKSSGVPESFIQFDLFEGLLAPDAQGKPIPGAAESWTVSDDGKTYTFRLRADGKWSDGTPVTAHDFVFSWQRLLDPKTASDYAFFLDPVVNATDIRNGRKKPEELAAKALDDHTFEVRLNAPAPYFLSMLVHHSTYAISKANYEKFGDEYVKPGNLVSNGAYTLAEAVPQSHIKVVRNPLFHDAANVKIDTVMYYPTEDLDSELQRFKAGELDYTYEIPSSQMPALKKSMPDQVHIAPYFGTYFYAFNLTHEPWKSNPDLRKALSLAVDREILIEKVTQQSQIPAFSFVPPGTDNFARWEPEDAGLTQAERDAKAKALIARAGYGPDRPLTLEILYNTSDNHKKVAIAIAAMWKQKLGVDVTLHNEEWATFLNSRDKKTFQDLARHGWIGDFNDAVSFLDLQRCDVGDQSTSGYCNPKVDELMAAASREADLEKRARILQEAEKIMIADLPIIPLYFYTYHHMVSPAVKGWDDDNIQDYHSSRWLSVER